MTLELMKKKILLSICKLNQQKDNAYDLFITFFPQSSYWIMTLRLVLLEWKRSVNARQNKRFKTDQF